MDMFLEIMKIIGLSCLGIFTYAIFTVWKKMQSSITNFDGRKFFNDNWVFWVVCSALSIIFGVIIVIAPDFANVLHFFGFAIESDNLGGFILLGVALAAGSDKTKLSGVKQLASSLTKKATT